MLVEKSILLCFQSSVGAKYKTYRSYGAKIMRFNLFSTNISALWAIQKIIFKITPPTGYTNAHFKLVRSPPHHSGRDFLNDAVVNADRVAV